MSLRNLSLFQKFLFLGALLTVSFSIVLVFFYFRNRASAYAAKAEKTKEIVEAAQNVVARYGQESQRGSISKIDAQERAKASIRGMRYAGNNYVWINDLNHVMLVHPLNPETEGTDMSGHKDADGKHPFVEFQKLCVKAGGGQFSYQWTKPETGKPAPKISYVKLYEPWGWIVGTGIYVDDLEAELATLRTWMLSAVVLSFLLTGLLSSLVARSVVRPVEQLTAQLREGTDAVRGAAGQVAVSSQSLANGATREASVVEETGASLEELNSMMRSSTESAHLIAAAMKDVSTAVDGASRSLTLVKSAIGQIHASSEQARKIVKSIDEIAFQTNLLALNAAVEAARAGSAGAGFAVVADEVRNLAHRAAEAAKETGNLIGASMENSSHGRLATDGLVSSFEGIVKHTQQVGQQIAQIVDATAQQSQGIGNISSAMSQLTDVSQSNAAGSEQGAAAAEELQAQSTMMNRIAEDLWATISGSKAAS